MDKETKTQCDNCGEYYVITGEEVCPKCQKEYMDEYWREFLIKASYDNYTNDY